jgi:hypothetical protein
VNHLNDNDSDEDIEIVRNDNDWQLEIYAINNDNKRLLSIISYDEFDYRCQVVVSKSYVFLANTLDNALMYYDIKNRYFSSSGIPCWNTFDITADEKYVCVSVENKKLRLWDMETLLSCLYNFHNKEMIKQYYFEFLEDEIGIALSITYNNEKKQIDINYNWDTSIPQFSGYISLDIFEFTRTK